MRPPPSYAPPDAPIRGHSAADGNARYIPGRKSPYATKLPPIDLPDDTEIQDADGRAVTWLALILFGAFVIAAVLLLVVQA